MSAPDTRPLIVGLGCRVPGARSPRAMWDILAAGRCVIGDADTRLFDPAFYLDGHNANGPVRRGRSYSFRAGQIDDLYAFDPQFFGISPRAATEMDPQQRLMLQTVWEAVEDAGLDIADLAGGRTGVMVGTSYLEMLPKYYLDPARGGSSFILGNTLSVIANRVSATFDFGGPSYAVDTACSSALYALHQGAEAIRKGEIDTAIIGGVHVVRTPGGFVGFSQARMLSPTGLCRAFDAEADGYVRSEACISVVLMHPDKAAALRPRIRARLLASAVNSDGRVSPLTVPAAMRQAALMRDVLARSGADPDDLHFYEAHGTGTAIGDPIEAQGLGVGLGQLRRAPLPIGSAKTNFGHAEPASGLVGLAKVLLAMEHREIPASLHYRAANPAIDFDDLNLEVVAARTALPSEGPIRAGLSSFGFGGTNAAVVLESRTSPRAAISSGLSSPPSSAQTPPKTPWLVLSAEAEQALTRLASDWAALLEARPRADWPVLAASATRRAPRRHRLAVPLTPEAPAILRGAAPDQPLTATVPFAASQTVFAFPGNGAQHPTAGLAAYRANATFRAAFDTVAEAFRALAPTGIPDLVPTLAAADLAERFARPSVAQPILFACQIAQARTLMTAGVRPDMVIGHSLGEIAALHIAGAFSLEDAVRIVARRSVRFDALRGTGGMVTIAAPEADVRQMIGGVSEALDIAAINSPNAVTVSGPNDLLARLGKVTRHGKRVPMVRLGVDVPYHSAALDPLEETFRSDLEDIAFAPLDLAVASTVHGRILRPNEVDAEYMWRNSRAPVRFQAAVAAATARGPCTMIELAPKPVFAANLRDCARFAGAAVAHSAPPLDAPDDRLVALMWLRGARADTSAIAGRLEGAPEPLPGYPWTEQEYFAEPSPDGLDYWGERSDGALAGRQYDTELPVWIAEFTPTAPAWVADHTVAGKTILPATALLEIALSAAARHWPGRALEIASFDIVTPAEVAGEGLRIRTTLDPDTGQIALTMRPRLEAGSWQTLARGTVREAMVLPKASLPREVAWSQAPGDIYALLRTAGLDYGPAFRRLADVARRSKQSWLCRVTGPEFDPESGGSATHGFRLDPMALDAVFHSLALRLKEDLSDSAAEDAGRHVLIPNRIGRLRWRAPDSGPDSGPVSGPMGGPVGGIVFAKVTLVRVRQASLVIDVALFDQGARVLATLEGVEFARAALESPSQALAARWQRCRPRWRAPDAPVLWPRGWRKPDAALRRLGLHPHDASGQAHEAGHETGHEEAGAALLGALRDDLTAGNAPSQSLSRLVHAAPHLVDDARVLMARHRGEEAFAIARTAASHRAAWSLAGQVLAQVVRAWRGSERLNVALVGLADTAVASRLVADDRLDEVLLWHPTDSGRAYLRAALPPDLRPRVMTDVAQAQADVIVVVGALGGDTAPNDQIARLAAPGAMVFEIGTVPEGAPLWSAMREGVRVHLCCRRAAVAPDLVPDLTPDLASDVAPDLSQDRTGVRLNTGDAGSDLPDGVAALVSSAPDGLPTLVHRHGPGQSASAGLAALLMTLKRMQHAPPDRMLVLLCHDGGADFEALARAAGSVLRSLKNEYPDQSLSLIAVSEPPPAALWPALVAASAAEPILYVAGRDIRTERLRALPAPPPTGTSAALGVGVSRGAFVWRGAARRRPKAAEVEVEVAATGLNFRDVLWAQGRLPDRLFDLGASPPGMGMEWAGHVLRAGQGTRLAPGTRVMGFGAQAFRRHLTLPEHAVFPVPEPPHTAEAGAMEWGIEGAAALPVAFATAWEALFKVAGLRAGERVLVHGAAGGVGMAALQIARHAGAEIFATAGSADKRAIVAALGADHVFDSRDPGFADRVLAATGGQGVAVVLNSLAGAAMQRSVACLAPFGRFVELGKRDFLEGTALDMRPLVQSLSYHAYDLDQRLAHDPAGVHETMRAVAKAFEAGALRPVPVARFEAEAVGEAVRHMQASQQVGKIVVRPPSPKRRPRLRPLTGTWVVIGGNGGVGLALAQALRGHGAAAVHLVSRSGAPPLGSGPEAAWAKADPQVHFHACSADDAPALEATLARIAARPPGTDGRAQACGGGGIDGVVHAAATLRDRLVKDLDPVETGLVIGSKLGAAEALDRALDALGIAPRQVLFLSSVAAFLGNPGQIAYGAANAALEALAERRRRSGRAGAVLALGPIADRGLLARDAVKAARLASIDGLGFLTMAQAVAMILDTLRAPDDTDTLYAPIEWGALVPLLPGLSLPGFARVLSEADRRRQQGEDLVRELRDLDWPKALSRAQDVLTEIFAAILRLPAAQFDPHLPVRRTGIDSLMAMELRLEVERRFGTLLPASVLSAQATAHDIALSLLRKIREEAPLD